MMHRPHGFSVAIVLSLVATLFACSDGTSTGNRRYLSDIGRANFFTDRRPFDRQLIDEDIRSLSDAIGKSPDNAELFVARGFIRAALTEFEAAISDFERAAQINADADTRDPYGPESGKVYYLLALAHWQSGKPELAVQEFSRVLVDDPRHARSYFYRGMASLDAGNREAAITDVQAAENLHTAQIPFAGVLRELKGETVRETMNSSFVLSFLANRPPQNRPFGYLWEIQHKVP